MRSPAEVNTAFGRSSDLLDQVDYRLAQTPEEKEEIYNLRYRAYLREGAVKESPRSVSPISMTTCRIPGLLASTCSENSTVPFASAC